jgi:uncharacterized protein
MTNDKHHVAHAKDEGGHSDSGLRQASTKLCTACGMCCNGVLFEIVRVQPQDSIRELENLGMQIKRQKTQPYFSQPCRMLEGSHCTIYDQRPTRCQRFVCLQLKLLANGEITEDEAAAKISEAHELVVRIQGLLAQEGDIATQDALEERVRRVTSQNAAPELMQEMRKLRMLLDRCFRTHAE